VSVSIEDIFTLRGLAASNGNNYVYVTLILTLYGMFEQ